MLANDPGGVKKLVLPEEPCSDVAVGVSYGIALETVLYLLLGAARAPAGASRPLARLRCSRGFGDSALRFEMRVWTGGFDLWLESQNKLAVAVYAAVGQAGREILPQREVRLRRG